MEFSTKRVTKPHAVRHNPYSSEGRKYISRFNKVQNGSLIHATPPRKLNYNSSGYNKTNETFKRTLPYSRSSNILKTSQTLNSSKNSTSPKHIISRINHKDDSPKSSEHNFKSLSNINDNSLDPFNIFSDEDDENDNVLLSSKRDKRVAKDVDKENNNSNLALGQTSFYKNTPKVYSSYESSSTKRKPLNTLKSSILHDISPEKVQSSINPEKCVKTESKNIFKFKSFAGKENVSGQEPVASSRIEFPHLIGFPNFGNTCYLNAVLQMLISLNPFIGDLRTSMDIVDVPFTSITFSLWNIISARLKLDSIAVRRSLKSMKENLEKIDGSFSGFKMQDANEFLTQVLDTVKDEIDGKKATYLESGSKQCNKTDKSLSPLDNNRTLEEPDSTQDIPDSTTKNASKELFDTPSSSSPLSLEIKVKDSGEHIIEEEDLIFLTKQYSTPKEKMKLLSDTTHDSPNGNEVENVVNPVVNNFEFELFESYRCLGCGESEGRKQKHFALYLNLPLEGNESIQKAVEMYMSEDERDLTCKKCEHKKAAFLTSFVQLPRVLIVQMKRYKYKPELSECFKVSSKVEVNLMLHLDKLTSTDFVTPPKYVHKPLRDLNSNQFNMQFPASEINLVTPKKIVEPNLSPINKFNSIEPVTPKLDNNAEVDSTQYVDEFKDEVEAKRKSDREKEEEEFQWAIKMSLQDSGMCYASEEGSGQNQDDEAEPDSTEHEEAETGHHSYRLLSVVSHFGLTTCTGHYVSDVLNVEEKQWYHYDDETVTSVSESVVVSEGRQKNGYIFFYVHQDVFNEMQNATNE